MRLPGDKSLAIRALLLASTATAPWRIDNLPAGDDVLHALEAAHALGARVTREPGGAVVVAPGALPRRVRAFVGESATLLRLLAGLLCTRPVYATLVMAPALARRPHRRFVTLLRTLAGADAVTHEGDTLVVRGRARVGDFDIETPDASAQQKSALLFAALALDGTVTVRQPFATRAHTEEMLRALGAHVRAPAGRGAPPVTLWGPFAPGGVDAALPGDPSSAALLAVAVGAGGRVAFERLSVSRHRMGFFDALARMGASVETRALTAEVWGPIADVRVHGGLLAPIEVPAADVSALVDEVPALACVCALAFGASRLRGLAALRGKESDRVRATAALLEACGVGARVIGDDLVIDGRPHAFRARALVDTHGDHRIAMAALALGRAAGIDVTLDDDACIAKSFPTFRAALDAVRAPH